MMGTVRAAVIERRYFWSELKLKDLSFPQIKDDEVLIKVIARSVNEEDLQYKKFKGLNDICACPGLECSGIIETIGTNVRDWQIGDRVCAILDGGGYADMVVVPSTQLFRVPPNIPLVGAASLPYHACIMWLALFRKLEDLEIGVETILIRDGANAMGSMAIQFAKYKGMKVFATEGTCDKIQFCYNQGADLCFNHTKDSINDRVMDATDGAGVDFVVDGVASRVEQNVLCCSIRGKVLTIGMSGVGKGTLTLAFLVLRHVRIKVLDLETKDKAYKAWVVEQVKRDLWPAVEQGIIKPIIYREMPLEEAAKAHEIMRKKENKGKILLCS